MVGLEFCETSVDIVLYVQAKQAIASYIRMTRNPVVCVTAIATNFAEIDFNDNLHNDL